MCITLYFKERIYQNYIQFSKFIYLKITKLGLWQFQIFQGSRVAMGGGQTETFGILPKTKRVIVNIFELLHFFLYEWHPTLKFLQLFHINPIFSETIGEINKP